MGVIKSPHWQQQSSRLSHPSTWAERQASFSVPFLRAYPESQEARFEDILSSVLESRRGLLFYALTIGLL